MQENLALTSDGYLMMIDLGLARPLAMGAERAWTICGSPEYTAPEVIRGVGHGACTIPVPCGVARSSVLDLLDLVAVITGLEVDLWAVGILLFELLNGYPPFCADDPLRVYATVLQVRLARARAVCT